MKKSIIVFFLPVFMFAGITAALGQSDFTFPNIEEGQVCVEDPVKIKSNNTNSTDYWNLCYRRFSATPDANTFNGTNLDTPSAIKLTTDGGNFYLFVANNQSITLFDLGDSPANDPEDTIEITAPELPKSISGIEIVADGNNYYGFVVGGDANGSLVRLNFGTNFSNPDSLVEDLGFNNELSNPADMVFGQTDSSWHAFVTNATDSSLVRFDFDKTLSSNPNPVMLPDLPMNPAGIELKENGGSYYLFVTDSVAGSIVRLDLGTSHTTENPADKTFTDPSLSAPYDIILTNDCNTFWGFAVNRDNNSLVRINFGESITNEPTNYENLGDLGALSEPLGISRLVREDNGSRHFYIANAGDNSIARVSYTSCDNSYLSNGDQLTTTNETEPSGFYYNSPGTFTVKHITDEGQETESSTCKDIQVIGGSVQLGNDTTICALDTLILQVSKDYDNIRWQDKTQNSSYPVTNAGTYSVSAENQVCQLQDTIQVEVFEDNLSLGPDTLMQPNNPITLDPGAYATYSWNTGATSRTIEVSDQGLYYLDVTDENGCLMQDTIQVDMEIKEVPNVFTPNGDGINDTWKMDIQYNFPDAQIKIYNRYGRLLKVYKAAEEEWDGTVDGELLPPNTYWYVIYYNEVLQPNKGQITIKY